MLKSLKLGSLLFLASLPTVVFAAPENFRDFVKKILDIINNSIVPLILALALLVFLWGVFKYFIADSSKAKEEGRNLLVWGLLSFFVMLTVWGIVLAVKRTFFG